MTTPPAAGDPFYRKDLPAHVSPDQVYDYNLYDPEHEDMDLFASIHRVHQLGLPDMFWTRHNGGHWVAARAGAIHGIVKDPQTFSSVNWHVPASMDYKTKYYIPFMSDPPDHSSYRQIANQLFAPKRIMALEDSIRTFTGTLIDELYPRGGCEFISEFAQHMPVVVFLKLLDLSLADRLELLAIAELVVRPPGEAHDRNDALRAMLAYLGPILEDRITNPGDDVLSRLVHSRKEDGAPLSKDEIYGMAAVLLTGGLDTIASSLGHMARYLAENPEQRHAIAGGKVSVLKATDELLRRFAVVTRGRRVANDTRFNGIEMKAEDRVVWATAMFNLDDRVNESPLDVDFSRKRIQHEAFGYGIHFCIGAALARLEFKIFFEEWLRRIPDFRIDPTAMPRYRTGIIMGLDALQLRWDVAS